MNALQELRERRNKIAVELKALVGEPGNTAAWTPENQTVYDAKMAEIDSLDASIKRIVDVQQRLTDDDNTGVIIDRADHSAKKGSRSAELFAKWVRGGDAALSAADWAEIRNTMSTTTGSEGGFSVQTDVATRIMDALKAIGGVRSVATVLQTAMGNPMSFPTSDGTSETGEQIAENTTVTGADVVLGTLPLNTYKFSSKVVAVPVELLQDSQVDIEAFVNARLATRIARITNNKFTLGNGTGTPNGVVNAAVSGKVGTTGQTLTVIFDDLVDLIHSVDPAYRSLPGCSFMMNDSSLKVVRKLKDSQGRPIFLPGYDSLAGPMPDSLLGYPITINQDMAVMAANAKSILFGNFSFYYVRDVVGSVSMLRFTDSAYAKLGQVGFLQFVRSGGNLLDVGGCIKYYANSAT
jgi:HK97 family phage major capsid protein